MTKFVVPLLLALVTSLSMAQSRPTTPAAPAAKSEVERGWFFFEDPPKQEEEEKQAPMPKPELPNKLPPPPKEERCKKKETWSTDCGFVNPGTDFEFQSKQRDELMQRMTVSKNDPKAVEAFQYYMRWVLERTSDVTNNWWYNMVQNPELDPTVSAPVSTLGLRLMTDVQRNQADEIFKLIKSEGGFLVYFSRTDCAFCHQMATPLGILKRTTGLEIRNASLDGTCMPGYEQGCMTAPATLAPAQALQVSTVPALFLYVPKNTWLRIATGVVDAESMKNRTVQFFAAYRNALLNGVENGEKGRPSVDFEGTDPNGASKGVDGAKAGGTIRMPTDEEIKALLNK